MPDKVGGLSYNKNFVTRSRMEDVLQQDEEEQRGAALTRSEPQRIAGVGGKGPRRRERPDFDKKPSSNQEQPLKK